ncbi:alpha/beta hydrolase [Streptococcus oralis]|uniref:Alpha/beta hydrolase n=1 Tax=Streptococcus jiangnanensis TaxID=3095079 RepID=A0ABU5G0A4_9STRE|nr:MULTISPECIES: alpha/beta hydrolase [Streptococcus]MCP9038091.1 alpha/beta hydrolase [Streptococcus oralis]MCP9052680.1 alpha/beta hydrolase [Streptococcus oralis]MCP9057711.1 alpha/beta hydrolase [Streptococcus oralis]MCP9066053.1 alpha/beta hydrolase [Streptococcus oralis]MCP9070372.1 alpha/beta hydrolase [Streptococcus oralis]
MKILKKWFLGILSFILLFLLATFIFHRISLEKEEASLSPMGQQVLVNGHQINIYVEGDGPETIVVLSGAGIASPILDFKNVSESLSKRYKVVIVERAGYGYSDDSNHSRDVMEVLSETRQALSQANVTGPFIILSHSIASLESLAWQEKYPNEVKALIGLDWALPSSYENLKDNQALLTLAYWSSKIGLLRYFPESFYIKNQTLIESERKQYKLLAYKQLMSQAMFHESQTVKENAKKVTSNINPKIPALLMVSNGDGTSFSQSEWQRYAERFASDQSNVQVVYMDAPHDLYHYQSDAIVSRIKEFLENN